MNIIAIHTVFNRKCAFDYLKNLYLEQYKDIIVFFLKVLLKYQKISELFYVSLETIRLTNTHTVSSRQHTIINMNINFQISEGARREGQTNKYTDRETNVINTFQLSCSVFKKTRK